MKSVYDTYSDNNPGIDKEKVKEIVDSVFVSVQKNLCENECVDLPHIGTIKLTPTSKKSVFSKKHNKTVASYTDSYRASVTLSCKLALKMHNQRKALNNTANL